MMVKDCGGMLISGSPARTALSSSAERAWGEISVG
jgi:hypothetical protein